MSIGELPPLLICHVATWMRIDAPINTRGRGRAGSEFLRAGELVLPLISFHTRESGPYTTPGSYSRAGPEGEGVGEQTTRTGKWENWPHPFAHHCKRRTCQNNARELALVVRTRESWRADQPCKYPGPESGLTNANIHPHAGSAGVHEGTGHAAPRLEQFHNTGKQQDNQEESQ